MTGFTPNFPEIDWFGLFLVLVAITAFIGFIVWFFKVV